MAAAHDVSPLRRATAAPAGFPPGHSTALQLGSNGLSPSAPLKRTPTVPGALTGPALAGHQDWSCGMPDSNIVTRDALGGILDYLTDQEKESLRCHGVFVPLTRLRIRTKCGCTPGCNHPGRWKYEEIAMLTRHKRVGKETRQTWRFQPPVQIGGGMYPTLHVVMSDEATGLFAEGGESVWSCTGASYHFMKSFIADGFDVVVSKGVTVSGRGGRDLQNLYHELLQSKKESGFDVPYLNQGVGAEFPPALLFDDVSQGHHPCVSCSLGKITHHWKAPFRTRLSRAKELLQNNAGFSEVEAKTGLPLTSPLTNKLLSCANQDAEVIAHAIQWGAVPFLRKLVGFIDFTPKWFSGCPVYFFRTALGALHGCCNTEVLGAALPLLPSGVFPLTPGCISRQESYSLVQDAIDNFLDSLPCVDEVLDTVRSSHTHVFHKATDPCSWCIRLDSMTSVGCLGPEVQLEGPSVS